MSTWWKVTAHENQSPIYFERWNEATAWIASDVRERIDSLLDDVELGTSTGTEQESVIKLVENYCSLPTISVEEEFWMDSDGFQYAIEAVDKSEVPTRPVEASVAIEPAPEPETDAECGFVLGGDVCKKPAGHYPASPHRVETVS